MLYTIYHTGTNCHVGTKSFGEMLLSPLRGVSRPEELYPKCRMHESLFHELCQSYHTLHRKKFINLTPRGTKVNCNNSSSKTNTYKWVYCLALTSWRSLCLLQNRHVGLADHFARVWTLNLSPTFDLFVDQQDHRRN